MLLTSLGQATVDIIEYTLYKDLMPLSVHLSLSRPKRSGSDYCPCGPVLNFNVILLGGSTSTELGVDPSSRSIEARLTGSSFMTAPLAADAASLSPLVTLVTLVDCRVCDLAPLAGVSTVVPLPLLLPLTGLIGV